MDVPETLVLNQFEALLRGLRGSSDTLSDHQLLEFEKAIVHDPSLNAMQHLSEMLARRGDVVGAQRAADMAALTAKPRTRALMAARWRQLTAVEPKLGAVNWQE
jgi:hypothetical protein